MIKKETKNKSFIVPEPSHKLVKDYCDKHGYKLQLFVEKTLLEKIKEKND